MYKIISICKGGGYKYCRTIPVHPKANAKGLYPLHRVLMENKIGRNLNRQEIVHHLDENKENNDISNLQILLNSVHTKLHRKKVENIEYSCSNCSNIFYIKPHIYRLRISRSKNHSIFCSIKCSTKFYWNSKKQR